MKTKICTATLVGTAPYQCGKHITVPKEKGETPDKYEERTWRERMHVDENDEVFIPAMALKLCIKEAASYLSEKIPGKGQSKYTKHFKAGIMVLQNMGLGIKKDDVPENRLFVPADGKTGGGSRVTKIFPTIPLGWTCDCEIIVIDPLLYDHVDKVEEYLEHAGNFIGMGGFRPASGGYFGRFNVENWKVTKG